MPAFAGQPRQLHCLPPLLDRGGVHRYRGQRNTALSRRQRAFLYGYPFGMPCLSTRGQAFEKLLLADVHTALALAAKAPGEAESRLAS